MRVACGLLECVTEGEETCYAQLSSLLTRRRTKGCVNCDDRGRHARLEPTGSDEKRLDFRFCFHVTLPRSVKVAAGTPTCVDKNHQCDA